MTEQQLRNYVVTIAQKYVGCKESDGSHKKIIDIYNSGKSAANTYKMKYGDAWCATFVSAVAIEAGITDIMPTECSCSRMIDLYKAQGRWMEYDTYVPSTGDVIMYDWHNSGNGDNRGKPDHVGIVVSCDGSTITVIEGNKSDSVDYRTFKVNEHFIRGYCLPDYASKAAGMPITSLPTDIPITNNNVQDNTKVSPLWNSFDKISPNNMNTAGLMLDKLTRISDDRRKQPLNYYDYISYKHRAWYDKYNLQIGDVWFMIPPEFIMITSESHTNKLVTIRQENTQKTKAGYHRRTILIDLVAHGTNQINGFPVEGPTGTYYVDGVRQLLAQFKRTPFLPIFNEIINCTYGIHTVALQSITIRTQEGFPGLMAIQITLQEMNMMPYIEMHSIYFQHMIDWDLMRFYYQSALTEEHEYKKLQSVSMNFTNTRFKLSSLNPVVFDNYKDKYDDGDKKFLDIIIDENHENYDVWVDSETDEFSIVEFDCNYSNMLANVQMSQADSPTVQFMGGMDTIYNIVIETKDLTVVQRLEQGRVNNDLLTRNNPRLRSLGFAKLESELVEFTGSLFVMIDTVVSNTVPGFPGLYRIQMTCVAYDIGQSEREQLHGFVPFDNSAIDAAGEADFVKKTQVIEQNEAGVYVKARQDLYAENKIRTEMEVYPDLHLPTYAEVDAFIAKCNKFRTEHSLSPLPYDKYPRRPVNILYGSSENSSIVPPGDMFTPSMVNASNIIYNGYVDPDFYVFYNLSYIELMKNMDENGYTPVVRESSSMKVNVPSPNDASSNNISANNDAMIYRDLRNPGTRTVEFMNNAIREHGRSGTPFRGRGDVFVQAGIESGLDPVYILAHAALESGWGTSKICKKYYNFFGIGAFDNNPSNSKNYSNDGLASGIINGAKWIANNYYNGKYHQTSLYKMRYNGGVHEYATGESWAQSIASIMSSILQDEDTNFPFSAGPSYILSDGQFDRICQAICNETAGESVTDDSVERAVAQLIFDRYVDGKDGSIDAILSSNLFKKVTVNEPFTETIQRSVEAIFCEGAKWNENTVYDMLSSDGDRTGYDSREAIWTNVGTAGDHTFWGNGSKSKEIKFTQIEGTDPTVAVANSGSQEQTITSKVYEYDEECVSRFAEPLITKTENIIDGGKESFVSDEWCNTLNVYNTSFVDMYQFSARGRLVRAFPTFLFCILDDQAQWYNGRKLWSNYYVYQSLVDIQVHETNDMPTATAVITITNSIHNLDRTQAGIGKYNIKNDPQAFAGIGPFEWFSRKFYDWSGLLIGGIKLTDKLIELHQKIYDHARLRENARIHLRIGYGSDPFSLAPVINGHISDISLGDQITMVVTSDGHELIQSITSSKTKDVNNGLLGLFGLGATQEASNIIAKLMVERSSWMNHLNKAWFEASKYGIEHFGLYFHNTSFFLENPLLGVGDALADIVNECKEHYDMLKNIYIANYKPQLYCVGGGFLFMDGEGNFSFNKYNMTPWDVFQVCTQQAPEYIIKPIKHQFDSRVFFGLPAFLERYRYDFFGGDPTTVKKTGKEYKSVPKSYYTQSSRPDDGTPMQTSFSDSPLVTYTKIAPRYKTVPRNHAIDTITIHCYVGQVTAKQGCDGFYNRKSDRAASCNYVVGKDGSIGLCVNEKDRSWCTSSRSNDNRAVTIECASDSHHPYAVTPQAYEALIRLVADICRRNNIKKLLWKADKSLIGHVDKQNMTVHRWFASKACPGDYLYSRHYDIMNRVNAMLDPSYVPDPETLNKPIVEVNPDTDVYPESEVVVEEYEYEETSYRNVLYEECKAAAQAHYLNSMTEIIDNQVRVTNRYSNTNIKCMYTLGGSSQSTPILHSDDTIDPAYQKTIITDTPIAQNYLGPDKIYEFIGLDMGKASAVRVGISTLLYGWQQQYQGELILFGCPGIKPHDYILVNDTFAKLFGISIVREVAHSFNSNTGYTTSVTPGMIGFETKHHSGMLNHVQNLLATLNCFSVLTASRMNHVEYIQQNIGAYSELEVAAKKILDNLQFRSWWNGVETWGDVVSNAAGAAAAFMGLYRTGTIQAAAQIASKALGVISGSQGVLGKIGTIIANGRTGLAALKGLSAAHPIGWVILIATFLIEKAIKAVIEYISNKNVVTLFPMLWENYPFVSGVKDGEKILAIDSNADATEENDGSEGQPNTAWTPSDSNDNDDLGSEY